MKIKNIYIPPGYPLVAIILVILLTGSLLLMSNDSSIDTSPPTLNVISKDFSVYQGEQAQIEINFSDNKKVTEATLHYRKETDTKWQTVSIVNKSYSIVIPDDETKNYHYFVTITDKAGNGPIGQPSTNGSKFYIISVLTSSNSENNITINRAVFIEEATATWCSNCPDAAEIIHSAYEEQNIPFYYVSMVEDENQKAKNRLENEYNIFGYPTVYMDGGYKVLVGSQNIIDNFISTLQQAANRPTPKIKLTIQSEWNDSRRELQNTIYVKNYQQSAYTGGLKVYISQIKSQWTDYNADSYHFSFLDYSINKDVSISAGENKSFSSKWIASENGYSVTKENLWIVAVLFDDENHLAYSNPTAQENIFDSYYVDATAATRVTEGTLPPTIGLKTPKPYNHYIFGREIKNKLISSTYIIGKMTIETNIESDLPIEKVTFRITGKRTNITSNSATDPYQYEWKTFSFGPHTITATVYDKNGGIDSDSIDVWAFIL
jgi:thiol-disulfide isomerase/thioredoxin